MFSVEFVCSSYGAISSAILSSLFSSASWFNKSSKLSLREFKLGEVVVENSKPLSDSAFVSFSISKVNSWDVSVSVSEV